MKSCRNSAFPTENLVVRLGVVEAREFLSPDTLLGTCRSTMSPSMTAGIRIGKMKTRQIIAKWLAIVRSNSSDNEVPVEIGFRSRAEARSPVESFETLPT